jgi:C4-dicarboxylate-specific signal transduction histidine kinase
MTLSTGPGFTPDDRLRLFEPIYTTKAGGVGMGLAISGSSVRRHAGSLHALANAGDGATFRISMPAAEPETRAATRSLEG